MWIKNFAMGFRNKSSMDYTSLGCCVLAFVLYLNTLNAGFVYDDRRAILGNSDVSGTTPWQQAFINDYWGTPLTDSGSHGSYRPLCVLSFKFNYILGGYTPWGYHLINNLMHCLATGLVVKLARHFLSSVWGILATGALFAAHPIHTEAVAGIVGRADLAACIFYLLTYLAYVRHICWRERNDSRQWIALCFTIASSFVALLFKETAITSLIVCLLFDVIRGLCGFTDKNRIRSLGLIVTALIATIYVRLLAIPKPQGVFSTADNPIAKSNSIWTRFFTFVHLPVFNFKLLVYPSLLSFDWGMDALPRINTIFDKRNLLSFVFYSLILLTLWRSSMILLEAKHKFDTIRKKSEEILPVRQQYHHHHHHHHYRKSRAKKKYSIINQSSVDGLSSASNYHHLQQQQQNTISATKTKPITRNLSSPLVIQADCVCRICKQEMTTMRHTSSCRAINNNNLPIGPNGDCDCHLEKSHRRIATSSAAATATAVLLLSSTTEVDANMNHHKHHSHNPCNRITPRSSRSSSSCSNSTTASNKSSSSSNSTSSSSSTSSCSSSNSNCSNISTNQNNKNLNNCNSFSSNNSSNQCSQCIIGGSLPAHTSNAIVLIMAMAFLTLPFLPATNLFFYVGFVVAERLLYLPSVGYCLLIGFGIGKLMEPLRNRQQKKMAVILCLSLVLSVLSARTIKRNLDWRDEESLYRSAVDVNPPKALGNLGSVLSSQGRYAEAKVVLLEALKYRPNMADVHFNLGILHQNQQDYKNAVENFQRAIQFRPNLAVAYLNLGTSLIALGRCHEAASILQEGTKTDGTGVRDRASHENARMSSYLQLGSLYADQGKLQRALAVYREALHSLPTNYQREVLYHRIGDIFGRLKQWTEAEKYHRAALEIQPDHVAAHLSYGTTLAKNSSRATEAESWFKRALKLAPEQASVYHHYAEFLTGLSRNEEAIHYRLRAAELSPNDYALVVAAATALRLMERKTEAEMWYRRAVNIRPDDARAHTNLGAILHLLGRTQKAADSYKEALRLQPGDRTTLGNLAKLGIIEV